MKTLLRQDSRDLHYADHFGSAGIIPSECEFDKGITNPIEKAGEVDCTAISGTDVCTNQTGIKYDIDDLWARTPKTDQGADPRKSMGIITSQGLQPISGGPRDTRWTSYMRSDGSSGDYAQTTMSNMTVAESPTTVASNWYAEWTGVGPDGVLPTGKIWVSGHDYEITGWRQFGLATQFHVKHWLGYMVWMPADMYNIEMDNYGTGAYLPTTKEVSQKIQLSFVQKILDSITNLTLLLTLKIKLFIAHQK